MSTTEEITRVLNAFGLHTDTHRWDKLEALFAPEVTVDYTSLSGGSVQATAPVVDTSAPEKLVRTASDAMLKEIDAHRAAYRKDKSQLYQLVDDVLLPNFDVNFAAQQVLGKHWRNADEQQRSRFIKAFYKSLLQSYGDALLDPTVLYSPVTEALFAAGIIPHYCANITGHGWRKVMRHPAAFTYRFDTLAPVPPVLTYLQQAARLSDSEAYGTFNMGAGFALIVAAADAPRTLAAAQAAGVTAWHAGVVEAGQKRVVIEPLGVTFSSSDLHLRA